MVCEGGSAAAAFVRAAVDRLILVYAGPAGMGLSAGEGVPWKPADAGGRWQVKMCPLAGISLN